MDPLAPPPALAVRTPDAAAYPVDPRRQLPTTAVDARRLALQFQAQLDRATMAGLDAADGGDGAGTAGDDGAGDEAHDSFGLDALAGPNLLAMVLPALQAGGATPAQTQALMSTMLAATGNAELGAALLGGPLDGGASAASGRTRMPGLPGISASAVVQSVGLSAAANARIVAQRAVAHGVDPTLAVAMMLVESGGNNRAVGDGGTSFGLFQLHEGGMLTSAGLRPEQAFDPRTNADVALASLARTAGQMRGALPGEVAAASQRPADPAGYARKVQAALATAAGLVGS